MRPPAWRCPVCSEPCPRICSHEPATDYPPQCCSLCGQLCPRCFPEAEAARQDAGTMTNLLRHIREATEGQARMTAAIHSRLLTLIEQLEVRNR